MYVGVCIVSLEPNVSCIHLGRVLSALASSSAVSSRPVASAENRDLYSYYIKSDVDLRVCLPVLLQLYLVRSTRYAHGYAVY